MFQLKYESYIYFSYTSHISEITTPYDVGMAEKVPFCYVTFFSSTYVLINHYICNSLMKHHEMFWHLLIRNKSLRSVPMIP